MFHTIPSAIQERMRYLEAIDERDRGDNRVDAMIVPIGKGELVCRKV